MGKVTGFIEAERVTARRREIADRLGDYREFYRPRAPELARAQAGRCMDCGIPFCEQGCPLGNEIPDWNDLVYRDRWHEAFLRLDATNNFPEFTGRLCPAPCEAACTLSINRDPVTIEEIEKEIIERAFAEGWVVAEPPTRRTSRSVAVVGSGPAGLAAAAELNRAGHTVTVFEAADRIGGLLRYGIPDFKLEKGVLDRRLALMTAEGIEFRVGARVGDEPSWAELRATHDAVLIAIGAGRPRDLTVPGRELGGVHFAMDFLERQNRINAGDPDADPALDAAGKRVIILGGGDTGSDCLGTALRQGAAVVHQIELLPRPPDARAEDNPWPDWPMVYRTSSSQEEGGERDFAVLTTELSGTGGVLDALHAIRIEATRNGSGKLGLRRLEDTELAVGADLILLAMGFLGPETAALRDQLGVELDPRGNVDTGDDYATSVDGVFCAGDANRGQSLIVWAIAEGRQAARSIDAFLGCGPEKGVAASGLRTR